MACELLKSHRKNSMIKAPSPSRRIGRIPELLDAMRVHSARSDGRVYKDAFKVVRGIAREVLSTEKHYDAQTSSVRDRFLEEVRNAAPLLRHYEGLWPIHAYMNLYWRKVVEVTRYRNLTCTTTSNVKEFLPSSHCRDTNEFLKKPAAEFLERLSNVNTPYIKLQLAMGLNGKHSVFTKVKSALRRTAKLTLNVDKLYEQQDQTSMERFMVKAKQACPMLQSYTETWPAHVYICRYLCKRADDLRRGACRPSDLRNTITPTPNSQVHAEEDARDEDVDGETYEDASHYGSEDPRNGYIQHDCDSVTGGDQFVEFTARGDCGRINNAGRACDHVSQSTERDSMQHSEDNNATDEDDHAEERGQSIDTELSQRETSMHPSGHKTSGRRHQLSCGPYTSEFLTSLDLPLEPFSDAGVSSDSRFLELLKWSLPQQKAFLQCSVGLDTLDAVRVTAALRAFAHAK